MNFQLSHVSFLLGFLSSSIICDNVSYVRTTQESEEQPSLGLDQLNDDLTPSA